MKKYSITVMGMETYDVYAETEYDSEILTEILEEKGCTIEWIGGDDEVYW